MTTVPTPATEPDPVRDDTWDPQERGDTLVGVIEDRQTFQRKRDGVDFEVLSVRDGDDQVTRVLCGRSHLRQLVAENDPRPGDGIAITFFGQEPGGNKYLYGLRVDKSGRLAAA